MNTEEKKFPKSKTAWLWENMKGYHVIYIIGIIGTVIYASMQLVVPYFSGQIVDRFLSGSDSLDYLAGHKSEFYTLIALMVGLTFLRVLIVYGTCMIYEHVSQATLYKIRNFLFHKIQHQDMTFYKTYRTGDLMTRVTGDLDAVRHNIAWIIRMIVESLVLYSATAIYFLTMNWQLALCILCISPFIFLIIYLFRNQVAPLHATLREKFAKMNSDAQENIAGNRVVKAFAREPYEIDKFDVANQDYRTTNIRTQKAWLKFYPFVEIFANMMSITMLLAGGIFMIRGKLTYGEYVAFSGLIWALQNPMRNMGNIMNEFQRFNAASNKVMELYYSEPEIVDAENAVDHPDRFAGKVEFRHVSFGYEDSDLPVLKDISFVAEPGETIAIMGETGCGKTSLINMIPRFFEPTSGQVLVDDINVNQLHLKELRKNIGLATQDVLLYSDTIEGNIAYGNPELKQDEIEKFAQYSAASEFINRMPEGYDTVIGERGVGLSGGQKQRISLARALAIKPAILILDDTTSAVDMETEKQIQDALKQLDFPCTKIIIAQRISTTKTADKILVLQDGRITEMGSHTELIAKHGYYYNLVQLQTGGEVNG